MGEVARAILAFPSCRNHFVAPHTLMPDPVMPDQVMPDQWYIKTKNGKRGPYSVQQLQRYVDAGAILPNSGVGNGQGPWVAAATVQGLSFPAESIAKVRATSQAAKSSVTTGNAAKATLNQRAAELTSREQALQDRAEELDARSNELDARGNELDARGNELDSLGHELDARANELGQREQELQQREQELDQRTRTLDQRESELDQKQDETQRRSETLRQRETDLERQQEQLDARAEELDSQAGELEQQRERQAAREAEQAEQAEQAASLQERETALAEQQADDQAKRLELEQRESDLTTRIAETQQLEKRLEAERATLQQRSETLEQREQALIDREQATQKVEQSLQELQLANAQQNAQAATPSMATDELPAVSAESILEEKKRLLQEFADRQASLSRREAELMRRENELTRRELDSVVTHDVSTKPGLEREPEPEPVATVTPVQGSPPERPVETVAAESESMDARPSSWQDVLGRAEEQPADYELAVNDVPPDAPSASEDDHTVTAMAPTGLSELRRLAYQERFGPCSRYDVDEDPSMRVDVSVHLPEDARDFTTLVTSGMSDYPIPMPNGQRSVRAELLLYVTHLDELAIQILRGAAKLPFRKKKGLSIGTTESLDELRDQLSDSQQKDCVYMLPVVESDSKPIPAKEVIGGVVQLFWLVTITEAERKLIDTGGIHKFLSLLEKNNHAVFFDLMRDCYVKRKGWFRR